MLKMKRWTMRLICAVMLLNLSEVAYAVNVGDIIGNVYTTDIVAYIDDMPIKSYNIGGRTAIQLEDLRNYGFDVEWKPDERVLSVNTKDRPSSLPYAEITKQVPGNVAGNIYSTDIRVFINGVDCSFIGTYNIGGVTCMAIEDLGTIENLADGLPMYSRFAMHYTYNDIDRVIKLYTLRGGDKFETQYGTAVIKNITSNYYKSIYKINDMENENNSEVMMFEAELSEKDETRKYCISIDDISSNFKINAGMNEGIYTINSSGVKEITYTNAISSNGAVHNDGLILSMTLPVNINGKYISDDEANSIIWLNEYEPQYKTLYMSIDFLSKNTGCIINVQ